jgi:hypothetical protein
MQTVYYMWRPIQKHQKHRKHKVRMPQANHRQVIGGVVAGVFIVCGIALIAASSAATSGISQEAESGLATNAAVVTDSTASNGQAVRFGGGSYAYGLAAMTSLDTLPTLQTGLSTHGQSSYDRSGGNRDYGNFLASVNGEKVMLNQNSPGVVYRIWVTDFGTSDWIKVYFDGESTARINMKMSDFFSGTKAPFLFPLVANDTKSSGGFASYLPLPYARSIRITTSMSRYYNIAYKNYPAGANVATWTGSEDSSAARALWNNNNGSDPKSTAGNTAASGTADLAAGATQTILEATGPRAISSLKVRLPGVSPASPSSGREPLNNIRIRITWDGAAAPAIDAPLSSFFGTGRFGAYKTHTLMAGMTQEGQMYLYLPMPFQSRAVVQLVNTGSAAVNGVQYELQHKPYGGSFASTGYLHTQYNVITPSQTGKDLPFLDVSGQGTLIGFTASYQENGDPGDRANSYLRGDERIYIDGSSSPAIHGTGTEDAYDAGFYFKNGPFSRPATSAAFSGTSSSKHVTAAQRFFMSDSIPFNSRIKFSMEHGAGNETTNNAWTLAYYYLKH